MTGPGWLRATVRKELHVLLPVWLGGMTFVVLLIALPRADHITWLGLVRQILEVCAPFYLGLMPCVLGAMSMGHEFLHGTWHLTLSHPVSRRQLLAVKTAVLLALIASAGVGAVGAFGLNFADANTRLLTYDVAKLVALVALVALVCGMLLAPWLTLICRSAAAGVVLSAATPLLIHAVIMVSAVLMSESSTARPISGERLSQVWTTAMAAVGVVAAWGLWRSFLRLELRESLPSDLLSWRTVVSGPAVAGRRRRSPVSAMLSKELRLQVPAAMIGAAFVAIWIGIALTPDRKPEVFAFLLVPFGVVMALLAGAVVSAEERRLGTLGDQLLLPVALWRQWLIKIAVMAGTTWLLTLALPALLTVLGPEDIRSAMVASTREGLWAWVACTAAFATVAVYVSSVARGGFPATVAAIAVALGSILIAAFLMNAGLFAVHLVSSTWLSPSSIVRAASVSAAAILAMALYFALQNHRQIDRSTPRVVKQTLSMWGTFVAGCLLVLWFRHS